MRLAVGCSPGALLRHVLREGATIAILGIGGGAAGGFVLARVSAKLFQAAQLPGPIAIASATGVLLAAALVASWLPAARAARLDVVEVLRSE
jgi:ABC-type antimicrobial peptide transport system permease subunit